MRTSDKPRHYEIFCICRSLTPGSRGMPTRYSCDAQYATVLKEYRFLILLNSKNCSLMAPGQSLTASFVFALQSIA